MTNDNYREPWQLSSGKLAAWYLFHELGRPFEDFEIFWRLIIAVCRRERWLYRKTVKYKKNGKTRIILIPCQELKLVQRAINKRLLAVIPRRPNTFGFSGGSVKDALTLVAMKEQPIFCADVRNAFPCTDMDTVFNAWRKNSFGYNVSFFLTYLTTWPYIPKRNISNHRIIGWVNALPQGAPTSPRLFDLCFDTLDEKLTKFATKIGGTYSRYADNVFFTAPTFWPAKKKTS